MRYQLIRWKFVGCIDDSACTLNPGLKPARFCKEIPAHDHWGKAHAVVGPSTRWRYIVARPPTRERITEGLVTRRRSISLPKWHDVRTKLKLASEDSVTKFRGKRLPSLNPCRQKFERRTVAQTIAVVDEGAKLPAFLLANQGRGIVRPGLSTIASSI